MGALAANNELEDKFDDLIYVDASVGTESEQDSLHISKAMIRRAISGCPTDVLDVVLMHRIRAYRSDSAEGIAASSERAVSMERMLALEMTTGIPWGEVRGAYMAFLAFDFDGSGQLDANEMCGAMDEFSLRGTTSGSIKPDTRKRQGTELEEHQINVLQFIEMCKKRRTWWLKLRLQISGYYNHQVTQCVIAFLLVANFGTNLVESHYNPLGDTTDQRYILMPYIVMTYIVMAYIVMTYIVMAYIVVAITTRWATRRTRVLLISAYFTQPQVW